MKDFDNAVKDFTNTLQRIPTYNIENDYHGAFCNLGKAKMCIGELESALINFNKALDLKNDFAEAFYGRGNLYEKQGKTDLALQDYIRSLDLDPDKYQKMLSPKIEELRNKNVSDNQLGMGSSFF